MKKVNVERRKYLRIEVPLDLRIITESGEMDAPKVKNVSPLGIKFETKKILKDGEKLELTLYLPKAKNPVHIQGKVIWHQKIALQDDSPYNVGCEFIKIEEDNKNTFLKYFCDLIYNKKTD